jgi:hypothetical protein
MSRQETIDRLFALINDAHGPKTADLIAARRKLLAAAKNRIGKADTLVRDVDTTIDHLVLAMLRSDQLAIPVLHESLRMILTQLSELWADEAHAGYH